MHDRSRQGGGGMQKQIKKAKKTKTFFINMFRNPTPLVCFSLVCMVCTHEWYAFFRSVVSFWVCSAPLDRLINKFTPSSFRARQRTANTRACNSWHAYKPRTTNALTRLAHRSLAHQQSWLFATPPVLENSRKLKKKKNPDSRKSLFKFPGWNGVQPNNSKIQI